MRLLGKSRKMAILREKKDAREVGKWLVRERKNVVSGENWGNG